MKKIILPLLLIAILTACSKTKSKNMTIELPGNATTGYTWNTVIADETIISLTKEDFVSENNNKEVVGAGGNYIYTFKGLKEGTTVVNFIYKRSWEEEELYNIKYSIKVDNKGNITLKEITGNYNGEYPQPIFK